MGREETIDLDRTLGRFALPATHTPCDVKGTAGPHLIGSRQAGQARRSSNKYRFFKKLTRCVTFLYDEARPFAASDEVLGCPDKAYVKKSVTSSSGPAAWMKSRWTISRPRVSCTPGKPSKSPNVSGFPPDSRSSSSCCLLIIAFVPWTQTITVTGQLSAYTPYERPQDIESQITGRIRKWHIFEAYRSSRTISSSNSTITIRISCRRISLAPRSAQTGLDRDPAPHWDAPSNSTSASKRCRTSSRPPCLSAGQSGLKGK